MVETMESLYGVGAVPDVEVRSRLEEIGFTAAKTIFLGSMTVAVVTGAVAGTYMETKAVREKDVPASVDALRQYFDANGLPAKITSASPEPTPLLSPSIILPPQALRQGFIIVPPEDPYHSLPADNKLRQEHLRNSRLYYRFLSKCMDNEIRCSLDPERDSRTAHSYRHHRRH